MERLANGSCIIEYLNMYVDDSLLVFGLHSIAPRTVLAFSARHSARLDE